MKPFYFLTILTLLLTSCATQDPSACECGQELSKSNAQQDEARMKACSEKGETLTDKQKVKWFEDVMNCVQ